MAAEGAYEETHLARCFLQIIEWVQSRRTRSESAAVLSLVPSGQLGHDLGRPAGNVASVPGRERSAAN